MAEPQKFEIAPARIVQVEPTQIGAQTPAQKQALWFDPNWRDFHKLWSMRIQFVLLGLVAAEMALPAFMTWMPPRVFALACGLLVIGGGVLRLMNQKDVTL